MPNPIGLGSQQEKPISPEAPEERGESKETAAAAMERGKEPSQKAAPPVIPRDVSSLPVGASTVPTREEVEAILSKGLEDTFYNLPPQLKALFKAEGERVAQAILELMRAAKATAEKIVHLIKSWLSIIPGVNRFFLEQEAKIKTDELLELTKPRERS